MVLNLGATDELAWDRITKAIRQYEPYVASINFRNNFIYPLKVKPNVISQKLKDISVKAKFIPNSNNVDVLFFGQILTCQEVDNKYLFKNKKFIV